MGFELRGSSQPIVQKSEFPIQLHTSQIDRLDFETLLVELHNAMQKGIQDNFRTLGERLIADVKNELRPFVESREMVQQKIMQQGVV